MTAEVAPLVIVGAGPNALALLTALACRDRRSAGEVRVLDPSGVWLAGWRHRFASHEISSLRSAVVHHPHPDPHRLRVHAIQGDRLDELAPPYDQPSTDLFDDFCDRLIADVHATDRVERQRVVAVHPLVDGSVRLVTATGVEISAARVVLATNPYRRNVPPEAVSASGPVAWCHSDDVDLRLLGSCAGRRIDVVGGGLTAVQLACGAARRGASVRLLSRRALQVRSFDVDAGWLGPKQLSRFHRSTPTARRRMIERARGGGTVPARDMAALAATAVRVTTPPDPVARAMEGTADTVWFATGGTVDASCDPLLADLRAGHPTPIHGGIPVFGPHLEWRGTNVHLVGGYAALGLGPAARNLWGSRLAAARIAEVVVGS